MYASEMIDKDIIYHIKYQMLKYNCKYNNIELISQWFNDTGISIVPIPSQKIRKCAAPPPQKGATLLELSLCKYIPLTSSWKCFSFKIVSYAEVKIPRSNKETDWLKENCFSTLVDEVTCFFGAVKSKRPKTVQSKIAYFQRERAILKFQAWRCHP